MFSHSTLLPNAPLIFSTQNILLLKLILRKYFCIPVIFPKTQLSSQKYRPPQNICSQMVPQFFPHKKVCFTNLVPKYFLQFFFSKNSLFLKEKKIALPKMFVPKWCRNSFLSKNVLPKFGPKIFPSQFSYAHYNIYNFDVLSMSLNPSVCFVRLSY